MQATCKALVCGWLLLSMSALAADTTPRSDSVKLQSDKGAVSIDDFKGRVLLIYFGYTSCADVCPMSLSLMAQALRKLEPADAGQVAGLFVTVDPDRDTVPVVSRYASAFDKRITGLTGTVDAITAAAQRYGAYFRRVRTQSAMGYCMDHSAATYVIDRDGRLVRVLPHGAPSGVILEEITKQIRRAK